MRISDWSSDVCSSDLHRTLRRMLSRRRFIAASTSAVALAALGLPPSVLAADGLKLAKAQPFSHDALIAQARALAARPYIAQPVVSRAVLERNEYEAHRTAERAGGEEGVRKGWSR